MKDVRVPGVAWAVLLVVAVALIHEYEASLPVSPEVADMVVVGLIALLKSIKLGTSELNQALDVIDSIRRSAGSGRARGSADEPATSAAPVEALAADAPERPNKAVRWLLG